MGARPLLHPRKPPALEGTGEHCLDATITGIEGRLTPGADVRDPALDLASDVIRGMRGLDPNARVAQIAARHHIAPRTLQRLFQRHVGVNPKWILKRLPRLPPRRRALARRIRLGGRVRLKDAATPLTVPATQDDAGASLRKSLRATSLPPAVSANHAGTYGQPARGYFLGLGVRDMPFTGLSLSTIYGMVRGRCYSVHQHPIGS